MVVFVIAGARRAGTVLFIGQSLAAGRADVTHGRSSRVAQRTSQCARPIKQQREHSSWLGVPSISSGRPSLPRLTLSRSVPFTNPFTDVGPDLGFRTLHGLCHRGLPQRHHLHRHRADELSSFFFSFHFPYRQLTHDLSHAGNTLTAEAGVRLRVLMDADGSQQHPRCPDLHATRERDEAIAAAMGEVFASVRRQAANRNRSCVAGRADGGPVRPDTGPDPVPAAHPGAADPVRPQDAAPPGPGRRPPGAGHRDRGNRSTASAGSGSASGGCS